MNGQLKQLPDITIKIKHLREEAGWNQAALAKQSGVSPAAISLIEKGERVPSMVVTRKLASALMVSIGELTGESPERAGAISDEANIFFRNWHEIDKLEDTDKKMIKDIVNRLKDKDK